MSRARRALAIGLRSGIVGTSSVLGASAVLGTAAVLGPATARAAPAAGSVTTPPSPPSPGAARLQGPFLLAGRVTVATNVRGERAGQTVSRNWTFTSTCPVGACASVRLLRHRAEGTDRLLLRRRAPGYYTGSGSFTAPLRCGTRTYRNGQAIPFSITVQVTAAIVSAEGVLASRVDASYVNRSRTNRTPCVAVLGHDAARYHGHLIIGAPSGGGGTGASG